MTTINFHGPFHFDDINLKGEIINNIQGIPDPNKPGIYVWGFMFHFNNYGIITPVNFRKLTPVFNKDVMKFIPYYVGKSESNIFSRIKKHHDVRNTKSLRTDADKYMRLSHGYMTKFFKDDLFPIKVGNSSRATELINLLKIFPDTITYHNELKVLLEIYPNLQISPSGNNHPITLQKIEGFCIPDTLEDLVVDMNNFWFCFTPFSQPKNKLTNLETYVFYSLKGKTISKTNKYNNAINNIIIDNSNTDIFKDKPSEQFLGY